MKETTRVHLTYIIGILVALNVLTLTVRSAENQNLVSYVSFAATVASLLLAILAIIYGYYSSNSLVIHVQRMCEAGDALRNTQQTVSDATLRLEGVLQSFPSDVATIKKTVTEMQQYLRNMPISTPDTGPSAPEKTENQKAISLELLATFSAPSGKIVMLACCESYASKKPIQLAALAKVIPSDQSYMQGWLTALAATQIISYRQKDDSYFVNEVPDQLPALLEKGFLYTIEDARKKFDDAAADVFAQAAKKVKSLFRDAAATSTKQAPRS